MLVTPYSDDPPNDAALARYLSGESALDERLDIERWAGRDPARRTMLSYMAAAWEEPSRATETWDAEALLERLVVRREHTVRNHPPQEAVRPHAAVHVMKSVGGNAPFRKWIPTTAVLLATVAVCAVGITIYKGSSQNSAPVATAVQSRDSWKFATAPGQRAVVTLVDGTKVTLGVASRLSPAPGFGVGTREVFLEGEAHFDVVNDATAPFIVRTGETVTRVLGTTFNVRKYAQDSVVQIAVAEGRVAVGSEDAMTLLSAGDIGQINRQGKSTIVHDPKLVDAQMQWRDGWLVIDNLTLQQASVELARWYDIDVRIASEKLAHRAITISFRNELPVAVVRSMAQALGARAEWSGRQVTFFER